MKKPIDNTHWTNRDPETFTFSILSHFTMQIERRLEEKGLSRADFAKLVGVSPSRITQVLEYPNNMSIRTAVRYARALGMKVSVVAYDDGDAENVQGPINSGILDKCWEHVGKPTDYFELAERTGAPLPE